MGIHVRVPDVQLSRLYNWDWGNDYLIGNRIEIEPSTAAIVESRAAHLVMKGVLV